MLQENKCLVRNQCAEPGFQAEKWGGGVCHPTKNSLFFTCDEQAGLKFDAEHFRCKCIEEGLTYSWQYKACIDPLNKPESNVTSTKNSTTSAATVTTIEPTTLQSMNMSTPSTTTNLSSVHTTAESPKQSASTTTESTNSVPNADYVTPSVAPTGHTANSSCEALNCDDKCQLDIAGNAYCYCRDGYRMNSSTQKCDGKIRIIFPLVDILVSGEDLFFG